MSSSLIDRLEADRVLPADAFLTLLMQQTPAVQEELARRARAVRERIYGKTVYIRGLIECSSFCKNDCYYCGLRRSNQNAQRYRLTEEEILQCCAEGWQLGFRTFVLQGGEDPALSPDCVARTVRAIKKRFPGCAVTLSLGEHSKDVFQIWKEAGADRYLLRHETASDAHYRRLHPAQMSLLHRKQCLWDLKALGYQVGAGFMVGSPGQTKAHMVEDLLFLYELQPEMIGIGPFLPHHDTPFAREPAGTCQETLFLLSVLRLMFPHVLLPATTALNTVDPHGRELGILAGANVIMPNLSPTQVRKKYLLYDNKACTGEEAAESVAQIDRTLQKIGYSLTVSRGDPVI